MAGKPFFPMFVDLSEKKAVVIGAGTVAKRRVMTLTAFTDSLTVIAPAVCPELERMGQEGKIRILKKAYEREDLYGADLVVAATDDEQVNRDIYAACKCLGITVNVCSDRTKCDFYFPGIAMKGNLVAGVTASGTDHKAAGRLTEQIRELLDPGGEKEDEQSAC